MPTPRFSSAVVSAYKHWVRESLGAGDDHLGWAQLTEPEQQVLEDALPEDADDTSAYYWLGPYAQAEIIPGRANADPQRLAAFIATHDWRPLFISLPREDSVEVGVEGSQGSA